MAENRETILAAMRADASTVEVRLATGATHPSLRPRAVAYLAHLDQRIASYRETGRC